MYKISAVSYLNTKPFLFGIENSGIKSQCTIELDNPAVCAEKLLNGQVDIGLVPVAIIPKLKYSEIITDYCIGAEGKVASVMLYSEVPLEEIKTIMLDYQSRTSVALTKILAKKYWKINPKWENSKEGFEKEIKKETAGVVIGDRTFNVENKFPYQYDLAEEWKKFTGLPFVFACWVANKPIDNGFKENLNDALKHGVENINLIVQGLQAIHGNINVKEYLIDNLSFELTEKKKEGLNLFLKYLPEV